MYQQVLAHLQAGKPSDEQVRAALERPIDQPSAGVEIPARHPLYDASGAIINYEHPESRLGFSLNTPRAWDSYRPEDLPEGRQTPVFLVDRLPGAPDAWRLPSPEGITVVNFVVGIEWGTALWIDLTCNDSLPMEVAAKISIRGVNPLTGTAINGLALEKVTHCSKHGVPLDENHRCPKCPTVQHPRENYFTTCNKSEDENKVYFWLDGWRVGSIVRQWVFTQDMDRDIASQVMGDGRKPTPNIGIAFHYARNPKPKPKPKPVSRSRGGLMLRGGMRGAEAFSMGDVGVAGGEQIDQDVGFDPKGLHHWQSRPNLIAVIHLSGIDTLRQIMGQRGSSGDAGWMSGMRGADGQKL